MALSACSRNASKKQRDSSGLGYKLEAHKAGLIA